MDALARRAGVAKPTLYAHYGSRAALVARCIDTEAERLLDRLEQEPPAAALATYVRSSPGWPLLLRSDHASARGARRRVGERLASRTRGATGLRPALAATAFLAAAAAVLDAVDEREEALRALAGLLLGREA